MYRIIIFLTLCCGWNWISLAQETTLIGAKGDEFTFIRMRFESKQGWGQGWHHDYPDADINFLRGVSRLTGVHIHSQPAVLTFEDDRIFEYPFLYLVEIGRNGGPNFSRKEIQNLREYLFRGGFLLIDDFKGSRGWQVFREEFQQIFPNSPWIKLDSTHPIFHIFYDIDGAQRIPGIRWLNRNIPSDHLPPENWAILDSEGRMMILVNWNSDMGDGWEHTYDEEYPTKYANLAYQLGINYLIYAMTH